MKIKKLRLKGWTGIKRGLGLDEITIDFSNISGLVAFDGQNGIGKSSVLENLGPYNRLASRSGALYQHVFLRDSERELIFDYQGSEYKTLLKIDSQSGKSEGFIWQDGKSLVNGKITEYSKMVTNLLGSPELFYSSVFCSQNAKKLSDLTTGELKSLLSEFLNLDKLAGYEVASKEKILSVTGELGGIDKQLLILNNKLSGLEDIKTKLTAAHADLDAQEQSIKQLKSKKSELTEELDQLKDKKSKQEVLIAQKANIEAKIKELNDTLAREQKDADAELNGLRVTYKSLQAEISKNEELLKQADEINAAADKEKEIQTAIDGFIGVIEDLNIQLSDWQKKEKDDTSDLSRAENDLISYQQFRDNLIGNPEIISLKKDIKQAEITMGLLESRDPNCQSTTCTFISAAVKARESLPELRAAYDSKENDVKIQNNDYEICISACQNTIRQKTEIINNYKKEISKINTSINLDRQELAQCRLDLTKVRDLSAKKTALEVAKSQYESVTRQMEDNAAKGKELKVKWENRKSDLDGSIKDAQVSLAEIKIDNDITVRMTAMGSAISDLDSSLSNIEKNMNTIRASIMRFEADLEARSEVERDLESARLEKDKLQSDISDWTYLRNACGKNGLQAMEIDGAAPIITAFANDLLTQAFGPLFTVKFRTINEDGKECLDIIVISDDGEEILLDNLSGGQRVWVLMALRLAMTLLSKEKSGRNFETFYADELDGALDPENALNFVNMYRAFMKAGGFKDGYFISHKPECRSMADHILMFEAGKNPAWQ
jgi:exonuclease SbcC